jgi:hypothetical protein
MARVAACAIAMMAASAAMAEQKNDIRGLRIGMIRAEIKEALPGCSNSEVFLADGLSVICAVTGADEVLDIDLTSKGRAYIVQYSFKSDLTLEDPYAHTRRDYALGDAQVEGGRYKWTLPSGSTLELGENRLKLGWYDLYLSNWKIGQED